MKKLRLLLSAVVISLAVSGCSISPVAPDDDGTDCDPEVQECGDWVKPDGGT